MTASTNTTSPTSATTYLANRPSRRNQTLSLTSFIQTLVRPFSSKTGYAHPLSRRGNIPCWEGPRSGPILARNEGGGCGVAHMVSRVFGQSAVEQLPQHVVHWLTVRLLGLLA